MHLEERIKNGMPFYEHGHTDPIDIEQEKKLEAQRRHCKEVMFDYNNIRPSEDVKKKRNSERDSRALYGPCVY